MFCVLASPNAHATEPVPIYMEVNDEMIEFTRRLSNLDVTPEDGLRDLQERMQKRYDDFVEEQRQRHRSAR